MMSDANGLANILAVDDTPQNLELLVSLLDKRGYKVRPEIDGKMALMSVQSTPPDLILLDINMPEMDGYEVCERLKADEATRDIPVIFVSALNEIIDKVKAFKVGGVDYVNKPFQIEEVVARIESQLMLYRQRQELERQREEIAALREKEKQHFEEMNNLKDQFIRTVSHDLKTPIGVITAYVDILKMKLGDVNEDILEHLNRIRHNATRMHTLVVELLDLARIESGGSLKLEPVEIIDFVQTCVDDFSFSAKEKDIALSFSPSETDYTLQLDSLRMSQVVNNILSNAIKYTPEGGLVDVDIQPNGNNVHVIIKDTGFGIPEEDLPHLFEKFFRVYSKEHREVEGTGLGLSIVKAIVEQHNGNIWAESEFGKGTTFFISVPQ